MISFKTVWRFQNFKPLKILINSRSKVSPFKLFFDWHWFPQFLQIFAYTAYQPADSPRKMKHFSFVIQRKTKWIITIIMTNIFWQEGKWLWLDVQVNKINFSFVILQGFLRCSIYSPFLFVLLLPSHKTTNLVVNDSRSDCQWRINHLHFSCLSKNKHEKAFDFCWQSFKAKN